MTRDEEARVPEETPHYHACRTPAGSPRASVIWKNRPDLVDRLRLLAKQGYSARVIADEMSSGSLTITKNSIIGACHRNGVQLMNKAPLCRGVKGQKRSTQRVIVPTTPRARPSRPKRNINTALLRPRGARSIPCVWAGCGREAEQIYCPEHMAMARMRGSVS